MDYFNTPIVRASYDSLWELFSKMVTFNVNMNIINTKDR